MLYDEVLRFEVWTSRPGQDERVREEGDDLVPVPRHARYANLKLLGGSCKEK